MLQQQLVELGEHLQELHAQLPSELHLHFFGSQFLQLQDLLFHVIELYIVTNYLKNNTLFKHLN